MAINNPLVPGDPYSYDLNWVVSELKRAIALYTPISQEVQDLYDFVHNYFRGEVFEAQLDAALRVLAQDGTLSAILQPMFDEYAEDVDAEIQNMIARIDQQDTALNVLESRMDEFSSLPSGSTAGDAELIDIRVGNTGVTYPTAGDAVRAQINAIYDRRNDKYIPIQKWEYAIDANNGYETPEAGFCYTISIPVQLGDVLQFPGFTSTGEVNPGSHVIFYDQGAYAAKVRMVYIPVVDDVPTYTIGVACTSMRVSLMAFQTKTLQIVINGKSYAVKYDKAFLTPGDVITNIVNYTDIVDLPEGSFNIGQTLPTTSKIIRGQGPEKTLLVYTASNSLPAFRVTNATNFMLEDLTLVKDTEAADIITTAGGFKGIEITDSTNVIINRVIFRGWSEYCLRIYSNIFKDIKITNTIFAYSYRGLWIDTRGEFVEVANSTCYKCFAGAIVNGGNNIFSNCEFNFNRNGFTVSGGSANPNNSHGSATGCQFNHNTNEAITLSEVDNGFVFTGCQIFYSKIRSYSGSKGIVFTGCELGNIQISDDGVGFMWIQNCLFQSSVNKSTATSPANIFTNNRALDGSEA